MISNYGQMVFSNSSFSNSYIGEEGEVKRGKERRGYIDEDDDEPEDGAFKSKNLKAERRRRKKLSDRLLDLRSLVPTISNMTKEAIITDAISYVEELKKEVDDLSYQLQEMETTPEEEQINNLQTQETKFDAEEEMEKWGIQAQVQVARVDESNKYWIKMVYPQRKNGFMKLMEAISVLGFEMKDINVTTSKGAILVTSSIEGIRGDVVEADEIREFLQEITTSI